MSGRTIELVYSRRNIAFSNGFWWFLDPDRNKSVCLDLLFERCEWNVESLCDAIGIEKRTFARITERSLGISGKFWLRQIRIVAACHLLREEGKIEVVARSLGFRHASDFTREFKKLMGVSPSRYKKAEYSRSAGHLCLMDSSAGRFH
jgi:AraC-like DNA-binding protein